MRPANRLYSGICIGAISAKQPSRRPLTDCISTSRCAAVAQMHPIARCTIPVRMPRYPAAPSLFGRNPIVPLCRPVQKQPAALQYRPVGRQLAALTCRPCPDTSSSPYYIVSVRISSTAPPHRSQTTPYLLSLLFGYSPVPRCATPFGCAPHCPVIPLLTGSTRCPAYRNRPAVPSLFEYSPLLFHAAWLKGNSAAPPPFGHDAVFHAVRPAPDAPYCTAMPPMRGNTLVTRPYPLFKSNPVARCPSLAGDLPRRPAVPPLRGGTAGRRLLFARLISRPKRPERVVFLFLLGRFFYGSS